MVYVAMATNWVYRKLITYQDLNKLGANDAYLKDKVENVSTGHAHSGAAGEGKKIPKLWLDNDGLQIADTNASHNLIIKPGSDLSADRILTITTGDAARTLIIDADSVAWTDYYASSTVEGWSSLVAERCFIRYKKIGKQVFFWFHLEGTSNATNANFSMPYACANVGYYGVGGILGLVYDDTASVATACRWKIAINSAVIFCYKDMGTAVFTASGTKIVSGQGFYETDN